MYKQTFGQLIYQTTIILIFHFFCLKPLALHHVDGDTFGNRKKGLQVQTMVFNAFVLAQVLNSINNQRLDNRLNVFQGILKN
jgi:Ca2+-transporting ATPase